MLPRRESWRHMAGRRMGASGHRSRLESTLEWSHESCPLRRGALLEPNLPLCGSRLAKSSGRCYAKERIAHPEALPISFLAVC